MNEQVTKHTPGPWSAEECRSGFAVYAYKSGEAVVQTEDDEGRYGTIANEANARLIAAAPELLDACEALARLCERFGVNPVTVSGGPSSLDRARAAIAKAKGEG